MSFGNELGKDMLDALLNNVAFQQDGVKLGLSNTEPTETGTNITEPSGNGYTKQTVNASGWNSATSDANKAYATNSATVTFGPSTDPWGTGFVYMPYWDPSDNYRGYLTLDLAVDVTASGQSVIFGAGDIQIEMD